MQCNNKKSILDIQNNIIMSSSPIVKSGEDRQSLITDSSRSTGFVPKKRISFQTILILSLILALTVVLIISLISFISASQNTKVIPIKVSIPWFNNQTIVMEVGTSRIFEPDLYSGYDNRAFNNYKQVTQRSIQWSVQPDGIVTVDRYGRVHAVKEGQCTLKLESKANSQAKDERTIKVVKSRTDIDKITTRIVNFTKGAAPTYQNLQKFVDRYSDKQVLQSPDVPATVKQAAKNPNATYNNTVIAGDIIWTIQPYADGRHMQYVLRNSTLKKDEHAKDQLQYFIGDRYLPQSTGTSVIMIESDNKDGLWVLAYSGRATHIRMQKINYRQKAEIMNQATDKYVLRCGLAAGATFDGVKWQQEVSDNDGLWTSMYGAGELMKYAVLKRQKADPAEINSARNRALTSLKAVLMVANVAGRQGTVKAKIRHLNNTRLGNGVKYSKQYLLQGKQNLRDIYAGTPSDGVKFFGVDAGKQFNDTLDYVAGKYRYSFLPLNKDDWSTSGSAATTQKHLDGFMSRTFIVQAAGHTLPGGLSFQRNKNATHKVISGAHTLYDYTDDDHPELTLGNKPIPDVLRSILNINGVQYDEKDIIYKGDTSTDQVVGHIFIYKIAYDILDDNDPEQKQLKQVIRQTMRNFCQQLINNGYTMVDATGQATKWTKLYKEFISSDYAIQDGHLKALQLLMSFKVAYYVTGQRKWKDEYDLLTKDEKLKYGELMGKMWDRWLWAFTRGNDTDFKMYKLDYSRNPSSVEIDRHVLYQTHFSDEEEAYLAYYLAFQLQEDKWLQQQYRKGLNGYWHSISKSENPLWYYIYQLAYPDTPMNDSYGQDLRDVASWQLNRHMIDTREYQAYIKGSRPDVISEGTISVNPYKIIGTRTSETDKQFVNATLNKVISPSFDPAKIYQVKVLPADERSIHKYNGATFENIDQSHNANSMQPSTTYTLPYWMGVYHGMIQYQ